MRRLLRAALIAIGIVLCPFLVFADGDEAARHLRAGEQAASQGRYAAANAEYQTAIALDPKNGETWYELGLLEGQMSHYEDAGRAFREAVRLEPGSAKAHCRLGQTLIADPRTSQDWTAAVAEFRQALRLQPEYAEAESLLGLGLGHLGETEGAITALKHAISIDPSLASAHLNLAITFEANNRLEEATGEYRAAILARPGAAETEAAFGSLLLRMRQAGPAEEEFRKALRLNPDLVNAHYGLARLLKSQNKSGAALEFEEARALEQREPDRVQAIERSNHGLQAAAKGELLAAAGLLREALALKPDYGVAHLNLGLVLADLGELKTAKEQLTEAVSLLPVEPKAWFDLGRVLARLNERERALQALTQAVLLAPGNATYAAAADKLRVPGAEDTGGLLEAGQGAQATSGAGAAAGLKPDDFGAGPNTPAARIAYSAMLRAHGDFVGAEGELLRALVLEPASLEARRSLADDYESTKDFRHAVLERGKILLVAGEDAASYQALGSAQMAAGQAIEAKNSFGQALALTPGSATVRADLEAATRASAGSPASPTR